MSIERSSKPGLAPDPEALDALLSASNALCGIPVQVEWLGDARFFLGVVAQAASLILSLDMGDHAEPAAVFRL